MTFRNHFDQLVYPLEKEVLKLKGFKVDLCYKIDQVNLEIMKLKKGTYRG